MSKTFEFTATRRADVGKGASRRLRRDADQIPAVIYGNKGEVISIALDHNTMLHAQEHDAFYATDLTITVDGKAEKVRIKDMQRHPYKPKLLHLDFIRV